MYVYVYLHSYRARHIEFVVFHETVATAYKTMQTNFESVIDTDSKQHVSSSEIRARFEYGTVICAQ